MATKTTETKTPGTGTQETKIPESSTMPTSEKKMQVDNAVVNKNEMKNSSLHKFFVSSLKDIYFAENAIIDAFRFAKGFSYKLDNN